MHPLGKYDMAEVEALVEGYDEWTFYRSRPFILVRLADVDMSLHQLTPTYREAVVLAGVCGLSLRDCAERIGVSKSTVHRRYRRGLEALCTAMNGGT